MKIDFDEIKKKLLTSAEEFGESGALLVNIEGKTAMSMTYGPKERNTANPAFTEAESRYLMPLEAKSMLTLCIFILADEKKLRLSDRVSKFIPEFEHGDKIEISHLLAGKSGIRDFYFGEILRSLCEDAEYSALSDIDRRKRDMKTYLRRYSFETVLEIIGGKPLEHEPGENSGFSASEDIFLREIIERVSGISASEFIKKNIFEKLGMDETTLGAESSAVPLFALFRNEEYIPFETEGSDFPFFTSNLSDMEKLMLGISGHRLFSKKLWNTATRLDRENNGLGFYGLDGMLLFYLDFENFFTAQLYFDEKNGLCVLRLCPCDSKFKIEGDNKYRSFPKEARKTLSSLFVFPKNTRMVPYGEKNWRGATDIEVRPDQLEFVGSALETIAYSAAHKSTHKLFVETEGECAVGLLDLLIDKKRCDYTIDTVIIDRRYQSRGFGKIMLRFAVDYLKKSGAKRLSIGVNRFNIPAQRLYKSVGFREDRVFEEGVLMTMELSETE